MTAWHLLISDWHWHPSVLLGCAELLIGYALALRFHFTSAVLWYVAGILVLLVALLSPLHTLGDTYLFSAHMLQHLLLLLVVPPLLLWGLPAALVRSWLDVALVHRLEQVLGKPVVAWVLSIGTMFVWHLPTLYEAALRHESLHIIEHLSFLVTATIFWWPIIAPAKERRLQPLVAVVYLFTAMLASSVLGIILTFAAPGLYPAYLHPYDQLDILPLLRTQWGLTPAVDQQLGGLLMWVAGGLVYFCAAMGMLARWYSMPEGDSTPHFTTGSSSQVTDTNYAKEVS